MSNKLRILIAAAGVCMSAGMAAAGPTCENGVIPVGSISTLTGLVDFSDAPDAAQATFDQFNAAGGFDGCMIEYFVADDRSDPQVAAQAARDLLDNREVVAMAGSASLLECAVNAVTYERRGLKSIPGVGVDPLCFNAPSVAPVNVGPYTLTTIMLDFAARELDAEKVCAFFVIVGGTQEAYAGAVEAWEASSGQQMGFVDMTLPLQGDMTPYVIKARNEGCDAVMTNQIYTGVVQWVNTADAQEISGIDWVFLAPGYTEGVAEALAGTSQSVHVGTEWEPFTVDSSANAEWIAAMDAAGLEKTAFAQGGYMAAQALIDTISRIDGPVTRESVTEQLLKGAEFQSPIAGNPWTFGDKDRHAPMQSTKVVQLDGGTWTVVTDDWYRLAGQ
ncbi:MAG: ABC transporter substrate-binding protein [Pseudomonadota bacterium]